MSYNIKDIEYLTGIKAHTLRIWEQRYQIVIPERTQTNIRYYTDDQLKTLLNISLLNKNGVKISKIAGLEENEIISMINSLSDEQVKTERSLNLLTEAMIELNEEKFDNVLTKHSIQSGFEATMEYIVMPFLDKIGVLWLTGSINPAQEHFISNLIRQKLIVAIDGQITDKTNCAGKIMLYTPENEQHELTLLYSSYLLKKRNYHVVYLGLNVPFKDLVSVAKVHEPDYLLTIFTNSMSKKSHDDYIMDLNKAMQGTKLLICGNLNTTKSFEFYKNVYLFRKLRSFVDFIDNV